MTYSLTGQCWPIAVQDPLWLSQDNLLRLTSLHTHTHWLTTSSPFISSYREKEKKNKRMPLILGQQLFDALNEEGWGGEGRQ